MPQNQSPEKDHPVMCGRYVLKEDRPAMEDWFDASFEEFEDFSPNYNVAPTDTMPVVGQSREGRRSIHPFRWGLLPAWAKEENVGYRMINARDDSVATKKSYQRSFRKYRCLVPASGFYEWTGEKGNKTPFYFYPTHEPMFAIAGLYSVWKSPKGEKINTYTIVTTDPNETMEGIHDRMPAMLLKEEWDQWLDPGNHDTRALKELLHSFPDDAIGYYRVSQEVNNVCNKGKELTEPIE